MKPTFIPPTLQDVWQDFQHTRRLKESTLNDYKKRIAHFQDWFDLPVTAISKDMILSRHQDMTAAGGAQANLCFRVLRSILSHAIERFENENNEPILKTNPVDVLKQLRRWNPSVRRKTLISKEQMQAWWQAVEQSQSDTVRDYLTVLLLTGFRKNEAACLKWKDIDFNRHVIILPTTKNGQIHVFPMGEYLEFILWERKKESNDKYIFTGRSGSRPITASSRAFANIAERSGVDFCLHDLRRTYATTAAEIVIYSYTIKRLLNHRTGNDVTAGYLNLSIDSLREAVQKIENEILARMHRRDTDPSKESTQGTKHQTPIAREAIDEIVWDSELTNLGTRTTSSGLKLYVVAYTEPDSGLLRYWLLGACSLMPVETARQMARNLLFKQLEVNR